MMLDYVSPVVEVHALHGEGVGTPLLVLQDPRLHHHHHLADVIHERVMIYLIAMIMVGYVAFVFL